MSKALNEVMGYANEDVASIHKHWIIFVKMAWRIIIFAVVIGLIYVKANNIVGYIGDFINNLFPAIPFMIRDNQLFISVMLVFLYAIEEFIKTYIIFKTVSLTVNNIQIKGKSGLANIGHINASLEQIGYVQAHISLFGRLLKYGSIEITLHGATFTMTDMTEVERFHEAVVLLQEAQKEGRNMRSEERNADYNRDIMYSQARLDDERSINAQMLADQSRQNAAMLQAQVLASIAQGRQPALDTNDQNLIEENSGDQYGRE